MTVVVRAGGGPEILSLGRYEDGYRKVDVECGTPPEAMP
jgi:hypothetical protein